MRHAITLHRLHGETAFQVIAGPEVAINEQLDSAKLLARTGRAHAKIAEVQVWTSSEGLRKRYRFKQPVTPPPAPAVPEAPSETSAPPETRKPRKR